MKDVVVIGAGAAGLTAALYALRAHLDVMVIEKGIYGGQFSIADDIENYPGMESVSGMELSQKMYNQVKNMGCKFLFQEVKEVDLKGEIKILKTSDKIIKSKTVIIANGLKRRNLGCKGEEEFLGKGVSYCATCDGAFFKNEDVIIVGGGNTALHNAIYLSNICNKVFIAVRGKSLNAENYLIDSISKKNNVKILFNYNVHEVHGNSKKVESVTLKENLNGEKRNINGSGVFIAIGYEPNNTIYEGQIDMDKQGYFISDESCKTNISGVYVAGDCRKKQLRQITTAVSDGAIAGTMAIDYILENMNVLNM